MIQPSLVERLAVPGALVAIFGYSGTGKTTLAANVACHHAIRGDKVVFLSDRPADVTSKMGLLLGTHAGNDANEDGALARMSLVALHDFKHQMATVQQLPFVLWPARNAGGETGNDLAGITTRDLNRDRVYPVDAIASPRAIIIDEFTRLYGARVLKPAGPGAFNKDITFQLGLLKWLARENAMTVIVTTSIRSSIVEEAGTGDAVMSDGPSARAAVEHFADASLQLAWTGKPGERRLQWKFAPGEQARGASTSSLTMDALCSPFPGA